MHSLQVYREKKWAGGAGVDTDPCGPPCIAGYAGAVVMPLV